MRSERRPVWEGELRMEKSDDSNGENPKRGGAPLIRTVA